MPEARPDSVEAPPPGAPTNQGPGGIGPSLTAPSARAERRLRLGNAFEVGTSTLCVGLVFTALALVLRKTGHASELTTRTAFVLGAVAAGVAAGIGYARPLSARAGAVALDRYHGLSDRLSSALSFGALSPAERTPFMQLAIVDASRFAATFDPTRAVPLKLPRDSGAAFALAIAVALIGLFEVRRHEVVAAARTIDAVDVTADDLDAMRDFLQTVEQKDTSEQTKAATEAFNQLISDLAAKRLDRTEAFRRMQALEDKLLEGSEADHKAMEAALAKIGEEMQKAELTRPAGVALSADHLADAEKELKALADRLRHDGKGVRKEQLEKMREALKKASEDNAKQQQSIAARREELKESLLKEKKKQAEKPGGPTDDDKSLLKKKERELERLDKEQEAAQAAARQLERLDRELAQAAEDLMRDLGATAADLEQGAEDINRMAQSEMSQEEKEQLKQKIEELREMIRQQGQGGKQQMVRLRRFQSGAHGQGQGQGQGGEGQDGQGEQGEGGKASGEGHQGEGGQGAQGPRGQGQSGQGQSGQGGQGQGSQGQGSQGQGGQGQGGQGGQSGQDRQPGGAGQGAGSGGETWVVGPSGEKILLISRGQGNGGGQGDRDGAGGGGKGGHAWGTGHDDHVQGQAHGIKSGTQDTQVAGQDTGQGSSRSEVIQGAAERGFASHGYRKVFREYHTVAEEALARDEIPGGYRSYVRRYFELIRPRDSKAPGSSDLGTPAPAAPSAPGAGTPADGIPAPH